MAVSVECRPLRHTTAPATPCAAIHSPFGKRGKETTELRWRHARGETRETIHRDRTEGRGAERAGSGTAVGRRDCETDRHTAGGDGGGSPFLRLYLDISTCKGSKEVSRSTAEHRSGAGANANDDGRRRRARTRTAGWYYGWTRGPGKPRKR